LKLKGLLVGMYDVNKMADEDVQRRWEHLCF